MAFDRVFQGPPSAENAPGTHQSPAFGIDVINSELYFSAGSGWEAIVGFGNIGGSGTVGSVPKFATSTTLTNSAIDDGITLAGAITSTKPLNITSASASIFTGPIHGTSVSANTFAGPLTVSSALESAFTGPVGAPYVAATVVYSVAGVPLPSAATAGAGARAFVSDADSTTFAALYVGSNTNKVPVYSDGASWFVG